MGREMGRECMVGKDWYGNGSWEGVVGEGEVIELGRRIKGSGISNWGSILYFESRKAGKVYSMQNWKEVYIIEY